jgi:hypothetical protein
MTQQPDSFDPVTDQATPAEADSPYASAADGATGVTSEDDASVEPAPDVAEEYAESLPIDPTPDQVEHYLELVEDAHVTTDSGTTDPTAGA